MHAPMDLPDTPPRPTPLGRLAAFLIVALLAGCASAPMPPPAAAPDAAPAPRATAPATQTHAFEGGQLVTHTGTAACTITLHGEIHAGTLRRMGLALQDLDRAPCTSRRMILNTGPALLGDAITLGAMLRNRGFDTQVVAGKRCDLPCLLVFAAGQQRILSAQPLPAQLVFSRIPPDHDFGQQTCRSEPSRNQQLTLTRYLRAMLPESTATAVYQKLLAADCRTAHSLGPAEAVNLGLATATR